MTFSTVFATVAFATALCGYTNYAISCAISALYVVSEALGYECSYIPIPEELGPDVVEVEVNFVAAAILMSVLMFHVVLITWTIYILRDGLKREKTVHARCGY